jgi:hypothetical protein
MKTLRLRWLLISAMPIFSLHAPGQGSLTPPGAPAPTMKTLDQIASTGVAINDTNTPGDANSLYVISAPGTYYLTSNVTGVVSKRAILINSSSVTVELNGFALVGVATSGSGISDGGASHGQTVIRNGSISGWGTHGVDLSASRDAVIHDLIVTNNIQVGLFLGDTAHVRDCILHDNHQTNLKTGFNANVTRCSSIDSFNGHGFDLGQNSSITGCVANYNLLGSGIVVGPGSSVLQCVVSFNGTTGSTGLSCGAGCTICEVTAKSNYAGILTLDGCTLTACSAANNTTNGVVTGNSCTLTACTAASNSGDGFLLASNSAIKDCTAASNLGNGIHVVGYATRVDGNNVQGNGTGLFIDSSGFPGFGNLVIRNSLRGDSFVLSPNTMNGPFITIIDILTNSNPHANYNMQ